MKHLIKFKALMICFAFACVLSNAHATSASGETGNIITLSLRDAGSTGASIYNDLLSGRMYSVSYTWTSSNESYTTWVDKANTFAYVKFSQPGNYTVNYDLKYSFSGASRSYSYTHSWDVTVTSSTVYVNSVTVTPGSITLDPGQSQYLECSVLPYNATDKSVRWKSNDTSVATVSGSGKVTAISQGSTRIYCYAQDGSGCSDYCNVKVNSPVKKITSISINGGDFSIEEGETKTLTATVTPADATDKSLEWSSSNNLIATVSNGTIKAIAVGTATVTCRAKDGSGVYDKCTVTVTPHRDPIDDELDLYLVGNCTNWEFNDHFKFYTKDYDTYTLYVNHLSGQFKIASQGWNVNYGGEFEVEENKEYTLIKNATNLKANDDLPWLKITFVRSLRTLKVEGGLDNTPRYLVLFSSDNRSGTGLYVKEGETYYLPYGLLYEEDIDKCKSFSVSFFDYNTSQPVDFMLVADANMAVVKVDRPLKVTWYAEFSNSVTNPLSEETRAKAVLIPGGVRMENIPASTRIDVYGIDGIRRESHFNNENGGMREITLDRGSISIIRLSNGQTFKVAN